MKLHRDTGVSQPTAWFMLHRIREAWAFEPKQFDGPVEVDETYIGGKEHKMTKEAGAEQNWEAPSTAPGFEGATPKSLAKALLRKVDEQKKPSTDEKKKAS